MSELPKGWVIVTLKDVVDKIVGGGTPSKAIPSYYEGEIPWMTVKDMNKSYLTDTVDHITQVAVDNSSSNIIPAGVPIIATRMSLGKIVRASFDSAINQDLKALFVNKEVDQYFFEFWYRSQSARITSLGTGTTVKGVRLEVVNGLSFPLAPLAEQKRIVEKLDEALSLVDTIKARLDGIPAILKRFRQSVLASAVSGKLTEEWRANNRNLTSPVSEILSYKNSLILSGVVKVSKQNLPLKFDEQLDVLPTGWGWSRFISLCTLITDGKHGNCVDEHNSGYYFLSAKDVKDGLLNYDNARQINKKEFEEVHQRTDLQEGDICLVNTGATVGKLAIVRNSELAIKTTFQKSVAVIKLIRPLMNNHFIAYFLLDSNKRLFDSSIGSAVNNLLLSTIKQMCIPVPPTLEQKEIVRLVDNYFELADTIEAQVKKAQARVDNLTQSILAKAFRGELVPQDPNDEPADKLLERIAQARLDAEALAKAAKKITGSKKKATKTAKA